MNYFDSHCHLQLADFDGDREAVLGRMKELGVGGVVVGVDLAESRKAVALVEQYDFLWAAVGVHPTDNPEEVFDEGAFAELARHPKVVGIGECGLDYFRGVDATGKEAQIVRFLQHIALADSVGKPLIIHCRPSAGTTDAHEDMFALLGEHAARTGKPVPAIAHFFTSTPEIMQKYLALGCYISFPCVITFTKQYDEAVCTVPLDRLLVETDSPFAAPASHRGQRNEPAYVIETGKKIAELRGMGIEEVARVATKNALRVFGV